MPTMVAPSQVPTTPSQSPTPSVQVQKPDEAHYQSLIKVEQDASEALRRKIADINEKIAVHSGGREEFVAQRDAQRAAIDELTKKIDLLEDERKLLGERVINAQQRNRNLRGQLDNLQRGLQFHSVEEIDKKIQEIEYMMMTESLTLKEEKKLIADIEKLKKQKPELARLAELQQRAEASDPAAASAEARDRVTEIRDEIRKLRDMRGLEQEKLRNIVAEREKSTAPLRDLIEERDRLRRQQNTHNLAAMRLQSELRDKETEWRAYGAKQRAAQAEQERWIRTMQAIEADKRLVQQDLGNLQEGVYDWTSQLAMQVIAYLKDQMAQYEDSTKSTADESPSADDAETQQEVELADGKFVVHSRKRVEALSVGNKPRKNKKKGQQDRKGPTSDKLNHTFSTIKDFVSLGFDKDYPLTIKECPAAIARLEQIIKEQKVKNQAQEESNKRRKEALEARLRDIEAREKEHMAKQPPNLSHSAAAKAVAA